jgi:predicted RNA-binding protein with PIN domain
MLYLFDGYNLLNAGDFRGRDELVDRLAGYVALHGARGVVVFDGAGEAASVGALEVRFVEHADDLLERLAADHRDREPVVLVSSDRDLRTTAGQEVARIASNEFARALTGDTPEGRGDTGAPASRSRIEDAVDADTRERLERWRRGRS